MLRVREQIGITEELIDKLPSERVTVAVLDSGIASHPDLQGCLVDFRDFVSGRKNPYDDNGHGTHVCGIICGNGSVSGGKYCGVAPLTGLVVGKFVDNKGDGNTENMLEVLSWIDEVREKYNIRVLNISVGIGELKEKKKEKALQRQMEALWNKGITVVCAAGNKGPKNDSISAIGINTSVITVGCHDGVYCKDNPKRCETYSGRGKFGVVPRKPDISCNAFY